MTLHYTKYLHKDEHAQWITFLHGAGGNSSVWFRQVRYFKDFFNLLLVDLRGHGKSKDYAACLKEDPYTFDGIIDDVIQVLDHEAIEKSHFMGISLGSILIHRIVEMHPNRISKAILGGAILNLNLQSRFLMWMGKWTQTVLPFMWIYSFLAFVIMPYKNHRESRKFFIQQAKKISQQEFQRWYRLTADILPLLKKFRGNKTKIPMLYIMGSEDYMFLPFVHKVVKDNVNASLLELPYCGHIVNIQQPTEFNEGALYFLKE